MRRIPSNRSSLVPASLALLLITALLSACGGDDKPASGADASGATTAAAPAGDARDDGLFGGLIGSDDEPEKPVAGPELGAFQVVSVTLGSAVDDQREVTTAKTVFAPKDAIHAAVLSTGPHAGLTLVAHWTAADGTVVAHSEQPIVPNGPTLTTFSLKNAEPWPAGMYQVAVQVQGHTLQSRAFEVADNR